MRISLELLPADAERLEGRIVTDDGRVDVTFSGTLDLLRVLEELREADGHAASADSTAVEAPPSREEGASC